MARHLDYRKVQRDLYAAYKSGALDAPSRSPTMDDLREAIAWIAYEAKTPFQAQKATDAILALFAESGLILAHAAPYCWVIPGDDGVGKLDGSVDACRQENGEFSKPLFAAAKV